jgi:hypothetical protein
MARKAPIIEEARLTGFGENDIFRVEGDDEVSGWLVEKATPIPSFGVDLWKIHDPRPEKADTAALPSRPTHKSQKRKTRGWKFVTPRVIK